MGYKVPAGISGRHVHLTESQFETLFGKGKTLTVFKPLSQPGQFACKETVTLAGPKGVLENTPYPGIGDLLARLRQRGKKLYVATSKPEGTAREILDHYDLSQYFDEIAGASMDGSRDDKASVIRYLLSKCAHVSDALMVGDTYYDIDGACDLGMASAGVSWGFGSVSDMISHGAAVIVKSPQELENYILG